MIMKRIILFACLAFALAACDKYVPVYTNVDDSNNAVLNFTGNIASGIDGIGASWEEGAQISSFVGYSTDKHNLNILFDASSADGASASFGTKIKKIEELDSYVAFYPYAKNTVYDAVEDTVGFFLPAMQTYVAGGVATGALPMIAKSGNTTLDFKQVCGLFRIALTGEAKITSIDIEALRIAGACTVNAGTAALSMRSDATDKITLSIPEAVTLGETATAFNVVLPPAVYSAVYYTVYAEDGSQMSAYDEDVTVTAGAVTVAGADAYLADATEEINPDLSADGVANCYVVTAAGDYTFSCIIPDGADKAASGVKADWAWATSGLWNSQEEASIDKLVKNISYDSEKETIAFTVPADFVYGNVLIALLDESNTISYGWHIWITSKINTANIGGVEFMDRNLGAGTALDVTADSTLIHNSLGLNYQWGRKDAHPGPRGFLSSDEATAFTAGMSTYSVLNTEVKNVGGWKMAAYAPETEVNNTVWSGRFPTNLAPSDADYMPGFGLQTWAAEANPCPAGYHVPTRAQLDKLSSATAAAEANSSNNRIVTVTFNGTLNMPVCGYRNSAKAKAPIDGRYWAQDHDSSNDKHGYWYQITSAPKISSQTANEIHSAFVRCVKN